MFRPARQDRTRTWASAADPAAGSARRVMLGLMRRSIGGWVIAPVFCVVAAAQRQGEVGQTDWALTPELQAAVERGHEWLAARQHADGFWAQDIGFKLRANYHVTLPRAPHVGVTSLALMSFLAGGHVPGRGQYGDLLERGLDYIVGCVRDDGYITDGDSRMYSHAFATLFLAEIYGMTPRAAVRAALQKSVNLIVDSQNSEGGWRYRPFSNESDMSITVCQVIALRSARNVGISVPFRTIKDAELYVRLSAVEGSGRGRRHYRGGYRLSHMMEDGGAFRYQLQSRSRTSFALTAAGVTTLFAAGIYDDEIIRRGIDFMLTNLAQFNSYYAGHYFFYYGHYYATQAFYIAGGSAWRSYFTATRRQLLDMQESSGAWPCTAGPGESFSTAVATLVLQIPYQYLPIFQR